MTDIFDRAQELEALQREVAIAQARQQPQGESLAECEDCGEAIPAARQAAVAACRRCVDCQQRREWQARRQA